MIKKIAFAFVLVAFVLVGCQAAPTALSTPAPPPAARTPALPPSAPKLPSANDNARPVDVGQVPRITPQELEALLNQGKNVVVVDTRSEAAYASGHIPGALAIPGPDVAMRYGELPRDATIVLYCS
jgi:hypothetical protein